MLSFSSSVVDNRKDVVVVVVVVKEENKLEAFFTDLREFDFKSGR